MMLTNKNVLFIHSSFIYLINSEHLMCPGICARPKRCHGQWNRHCLCIHGANKLMGRQIINKLKKYMIIIYTPNTAAPKYIKQMLMAIKGENDSNTIIVATLIPH